MTEQADNTLGDMPLVTIASGKGGVGKTWLAVTLSHALAEEGQKIALFDGDLGLANVDIQLGITPRKDLGNVLSGESDLRDIIFPFADPSGCKFDILPGKSGSGALGALSRGALKDIRDKLVDLSDDYDCILLDLAAGVDPSVTTLSQHGGKVIVVMTADPTSLTDAYAFIKITHMNHPGANIHIVVNNVASKSEGEKAFGAIKKACEGFLKISPPLAAIIRHDDKVVDAIRSQAPLLSRHPMSEAAKDIKKLAAYLVKG